MKAKPSNAKVKLLRRAAIEKRIDVGDVERAVEVRLQDGAHRRALPPAEARLQAGGGGDYPEALNEALHTAVHRLSWRGRGATRLVVLLADAPPHLDYGGPYYDDDMMAALGKGIVFGHDTVNFVANRIGVLGMMGLIDMAVKGGYTIEEIDAIFGPPLGRPKSAVFRTADMVGLDTVIHVAENCYDNLPADEAREVFKVPELLREMVKRGLRGEKSGAGFYKKTPEGILSLDLKTLEYRPQQKVRFASLGAAKNANTVADRIRARIQKCLHGFIVTLLRCQH